MQNSWLKPLSLDDWFRQPEPATRWLVREAIPAESLVMLSGPRKRGFKTFFAMTWAQLLTWGTAYKPFPRWKAEASGRVLFLEQESTSWDNRRRFKNIMAGHGLIDNPEHPKIIQPCSGDFRF